MGNFTTKDSHGPTGAHGDSFHTPPASPQSDLPAFVPHLPQLTTPLSSLAAPVSPPPPIPVITSTVKKSQPTAITASPTASTFSPEQRPHAPVTSSSLTAGLSISPVHSKPGVIVVKGAPGLGRNGGPPTSTPRTPSSKGKTVPLSPSKSPSPPCSASPLVGSSSSQGWSERDSGLSQSLLPAHESGDNHAEELGRLLEDCRTLLGIAASRGGTTDTAEILRHFLTEVKNLKSTLETERGEWLQFQADLQVAVAVADRLRAETEEEMTALRTVHKDVERELAAAHQRQKETDAQLVTLRGELKESRQRLATLNQAQGKPVPLVFCHEAETPSTEPTSTSEGKEGTQGGTDGTVHRLGRDGPERSCENDDVTKNGVGEEARSGCRGVAKRYLRNVTNEQRTVGEEARATETRRTVTTERSRSLSRLPATSDSLTVPNGTYNSAATDVHTNMNAGQLRGRKESRTSMDIGKREETLNKYNSTLSPELPPNKSQDGFNMLLRRHGGSKRNSLLRWCQSRTQGYKNIDITNFSSSWADGLAFCAVYHTYLPSHVPYSSLTPENKRDNLSLAFKTGETAGIAQTLTVDEMLRAGGPDWQRVLSYVESMYRHFEM